MDDLTSLEQWKKACDRWQKIVEVQDAEIEALKRQLQYPFGRTHDLSDFYDLS